MSKGKGQYLKPFVSLTSAKNWVNSRAKGQVSIIISNKRLGGDTIWPLLPIPKLEPID